MTTATAPQARDASLVIALREIIDAYEILMETDGARFDMSMTNSGATCARWAAGRLENPIIRARALLADR